jgi:predicted secreted protein
MAPKQGRLSSLGISTTGGAPYTSLGSLIDATFNRAKSEIDVTDRDSLDWTEFLAGRKSATIDGVANWDVADAQLMALLTAWDDDSGIDILWRFDTIAGEEEFTASVIVTDFTTPSPGEDKSSVNFTLRITGAVTQATQT